MATNTGTITSHGAQPDIGYIRFKHKLPFPGKGSINRVCIVLVYRFHINIIRFGFRHCLVIQRATAFMLAEQVYCGSVTVGVFG